LRAAVAAGAALLALAAGPAAAHGNLQGVGDFYAGLLHPLVVPSELLALAAVGLALATSGRAACRAGLPALALGLGIGLAIGLGRTLPPELATPALLAIALAGAGPVTAGLRLPPPLAAGLALLGGVAIAVDAAPEAGALPARLVAGGATILGGAAAITLVVGLVLGRERHWQRVAVRVAGSWIAASAMLYFAWFFTAR